MLHATKDTLKARSGLGYLGMLRHKLAAKRTIFFVLSLAVVVTVVVVLHAV